MSMYATLSASVNCPTCGQTIPADWQFYFGDVSQLPTYEIGDEIRWGRTNHGDQSMKDVVAVGYYDGTHDFCRACSIEHALVDIQIANHMIREVTFRSTEAWIPHTLFVGPDRKPYP